MSDPSLDCSVSVPPRGAGHIKNSHQRAGKSDKSSLHSRPSLLGVTNRQVLNVAPLFASRYAPSVRWVALAGHNPRIRKIEGT